VTRYIGLSIEDLINRYVQGDRVFAGVRVYAYGLHNVNLKGVNLCGAKLEGDWTGVNLSESWLRGANL
jgi:uncharacterized protein YjbI with pentapeptide repeats